MAQSMIFERRGGLTIGFYPVLEILAPRLEIHQSTRGGGVSRGPFTSLNIGSGLGDVERRVAENRALLIEATRTAPRRLARAQQVHGARVAVATRGGLYGGADGLVTSTPGLTLAIRTADCYPVVIYAISERILAALHVGRGGADGGIIERGIGLMRGLSPIEPANCVACIGPGICPKCYEVGEEIASRFEEPVRKRIGGKHHLDLERHCRAELERNGIPKSRIYSSGLCTSCRQDLFFSHRRDGAETGRHWTLARISPL